MAKFAKKGNPGKPKGSNKTGKTNPTHRSNGENVGRENHRMGTQKCGGIRS